VRNAPFSGIGRHHLASGSEIASTLRLKAVANRHLRLHLELLADDVLGHYPFAGAAPPMTTMMTVATSVDAAIARSPLADDALADEKNVAGVHSHRDGAQHDAADGSLHAQLML